MKKNTLDAVTTSDKDMASHTVIILATREEGNTSIEIYEVHIVDPDAEVVEKLIVNCE